MLKTCLSSNHIVTVCLLVILCQCAPDDLWGSALSDMVLVALPVLTLGSALVRQGLGCCL